MSAKIEALQEELRRRELELFALSTPFMGLFVGIVMTVCGSLTLGQMTPVNFYLLIGVTALTAVSVWLLGPHWLRAHRRLMKVQKKLPPHVMANPSE